MRDAFHTPQYLGLEQSQRLQLSSKSFVYFLEYFIGMSTAKFCTFTVEQQGTAPHLDPSLEAVLRSHGVHDEIIMNFRCNDVLSQAVFVALDSSEEGLRSVAKDAFGIDLSTEGGFIHKREMAKVIASWKESRIQSETKTKVDAVARAHGEPVSYLPSEWVKILKTFKDKYGQRIPEYYLPAQCYFEVFEEKVNEGRLRAETLAQVISLEEEEAQERSKPEHPKQLHLTLEANLTLTDANISGAVADKVSSSFQLVAPGQASSARACTLQGPGRTHVAIVVGRAFEQEELCFSTAAGKLRSDGWARLEPLPGVRISNSERGLATHGRRRSCHRCSTLGYVQLSPTPHGTLDHVSHSGQCQVRKGQTDQEHSLGKQSQRAREAACQHQEQQVAIPSQTVGPHRKTLGREVEFTWWQKSRSREKLRKRSAQRHQQEQQAPSSSKGSKFETIQKKHGLTLFHEKARSSPGICFRFQKHACFDSGKCGREHICIGCGKAGVPYNDCFCLESSA